MTLSNPLRVLKNAYSSFQSAAFKNAYELKFRSSQNAEHSFTKTAPFQIPPKIRQRKRMW